MQRNDFNRFNGGMTPVVKALLIANIAVFFLELLLPDWFVGLFGLTASGIRHGFVWQFFTYMFLHSTSHLFHIVFNLLVLFMIGPETERGIGSRHFLSVYLLSGMVGGLMWVLMGYTSPCIGASGAIYGMLGAFAALWPRREITLLIFFVLPVTLRAWVLVCGLAVMEFVSSLMSSAQPGGTGTVAHLVHLFGLAAGVFYTYFLVHRGTLPFFGKRRPRLRVLDGGFRGQGTGKTEEFFRIDPAQVDQLLDKIAQHGMHSLTARERAMLEAASKRK